MNNEEIQALMTQLKDAGLTEEDIANGILWPMFRDGKISREDLATLCSALGLELAEDFDKDTEADPIDGGNNNGGDKNPAENVTKEEAEEAKEIKPGESKEEFKERIEDAKESPVPNSVPNSNGGDDADAGDEEENDEEWDDVKKNIFKL